MFLFNRLYTIGAMIPRIYTFGAQSLLRRSYIAVNPVVGSSTKKWQSPLLGGCCFVRSLSSPAKPPEHDTHSLAKLAAPSELGVTTKAGKIIVTSTGDSLIIEKANLLPEPLQIVRIEADDPPRDVRKGPVILLIKMSYLNLL